MRCFDPVLYQKYIDGELTQKEKNKLEKHLINCNECKEFVEKIKKEEIDLRGLFREEDIDLTNVILERVYEIRLEKKGGKEHFLYLLVLLLVPSLSSLIFSFISSIPVIGNLLSPLYYVSSIFFAVLNKLQTIDFQLIFIEAGVISILIFTLFLFKNLRIKEVLK